LKIGQTLSHFFSSVLRNVNPNHPTLAEDLAIYTDIIRQIHKDGGDWYFYDVNFRQTLQNDDTLYWSYVDQILYTRALNRNITKQNNMQIKIQQSPYSNIKPFPTAASRRTCHKYNEGRPCDGFCGYPHICRLCFKGCNATETRHKTMCHAKQELSQPSTQPAPPIRSKILNKLPTPVRADTLETYLQGYDPDKKLYLLNGFRNGFSLEYTGPRNSYNCCNLKSAKDKPEVVQEKIDKEVACLRVMSTSISPFQI